MKCAGCQKELNLLEKPSRRDTCDFCGADLHSCHNCKFFDETAYNECHEIQADRVVEKDRANFCDYFTMREGGAEKVTNEADEAKKALEDLFK